MAPRTKEALATCIGLLSMPAITLLIVLAVRTFLPPQQVNIFIEEPHISGEAIPPSDFLVEA